jgi:transcriptional regulator with XRE-family HTH domain
MAWVRAGDLAGRLREVREALGLTQGAFAELMGVVDQSVSDYENSRSQPSKSRLERLAKQLQIPVAVFSEGGPSPTAALKPPRSPGEARSPGEPSPGARGPGRRLEDVELRASNLRKDAAALDKLIHVMRAYRDAGLTVGPGILDDWLKIAAANPPGGLNGPPRPPGRPPGPAAGPDPP